MFNTIDLSSLTSKNESLVTKEEELAQEQLESFNLASMMQQQSQLFGSNQGKQVRKTLTCVDFNSDIFLKAVESAELLLNEPNKSVKTPISLLQEIMVKCGLASPNYEEVALDGIAQHQSSGHEPIFGFQVRIQLIDNGEIISLARGSSKKRAKHACALEVLDQFKLQSSSNRILSAKLHNLTDELRRISQEDNKVNVGSTNKETQSTMMIDDDCSNPVGELIELTQKCSLRPPEFEFVDEFGPSHDRQFKCEARLGEHKSEAVARSKKTAKRLSAIALLNKLKECNFGAARGVYENENGVGDELELNILKSKEKTNGKRAVESIQQFKMSTKDCVKRLVKTKNPNDLNKAFLEQLASEENFKFQFYKLKPFEQTQRVLLSLYTNPVLVLYGKGETLDSAVDDASKNALETIQLFCSRT